MNVDAHNDDADQDSGDLFPASSDPIAEDDFAFEEESSHSVHAALEIEPPGEASLSTRNIADEDALASSLFDARRGMDGQDVSTKEIDAENELSPQRLYIELKSIEDEVKALIEPRDPVRKRKLGGTRRWRDLEEDIIQWRFGERFDETTLQRVQCLIARRHQLYQRLRFLAGTRPTWNS